MTCTTRGSTLTAPGRLVRTFGALAVALGVGCGLPRPTDDVATTEIRVGLIPATATSPILLSVEDGDFASRGLSVTLQPVSDTAQAMVSVATGQFEIGNISLGAAAFSAFSQGTDLKIIAAAAAEPPDHGGSLPLIVRTDLVDSGAVKTVADLKGRKVALNGVGIIPEYALAKALATANLKPTDVQVVTMPFPAMLAALGTGAIDAGLLLEPNGAQAVASGVGKVLVDDYNRNAQDAVLVVNSRFLEQHREAVTRFLEVYVRAIRRLSDGKFKNDDEALAAVQKYTNAPPEVIRLAADPYWPPDARPNLDSIRAEQTFFQPTAMDIQKLVDYGPLDAALKTVS